MPKNLNQEEQTPKAYNPKSEEKEVLEYLKKRIPILKDTKKNILDNIDFEDIMRQADREYQPRKFEQGKTGLTIQSDELTGHRGQSIVNITGQEGDEWRSNISEPTLLAKIQTALSILIDQNPNAVFKATAEKYKDTTPIAKSLWKRNWNKGNSKNTLKLFAFDLCKYGWAIGKTSPRVVKREGKVLTRLDQDNPEKNQFKDVNITEFNDVFREKLDPYRTWIDDMTNLTDPFSMNDWYYEKDFSRDAFEIEFEQYANSDKVSFGTIVKDEDSVENNDDATTQRRDIITLGFYESKNKDLYSIHSPKDNVVVYYSPLPNNEKKLSCWWSIWNIRDSRTPYGIGLFEILKQNKVLYDRLKNMTVDQLVMAIYPLLFSSGKEDNIVISPGIIKQKKPGTTIDQVKINYDPRGWDGVAQIDEKMDENTGITKTLAGEIVGKTLGETLQAKDSALRRLKLPMDNIKYAIEIDAYITLSWMNQIYSVPEIMEFADEDELKRYQKLVGTQANFVQQEESGTITADFLPVLDLSLSENQEGILIENPEDRFFKITRKSPEELTQAKEDGQNVTDLLSVQSINWQGVINVEARSIIAPSQELERQRKLELFNIVVPVIKTMSDELRGSPSEGIAPDPERALDLMKPIKQILEIQDEKPKNWLPDKIVELDENPELLKQMQKEKQKAANPLFLKNGGQEMGGMSGGGTPTPQAASSVKPREAVTNPLRRAMSDLGKMFKGS